MHDLSGTVVAIVDTHDAGREALAALAAEQYTAEFLHGEEGRLHLAQEDEDGLSAVVRKLMLAFGDEARIMDRLDRALEEGAAVVSVLVDADNADRVAIILEEHGGHDMWRLGEWSFNPIGSEGSGEG